MAHLHQRCVGCEIQSRPGGTERPILRYERWGNRRRRSRRRGAATALEWRALRSAPKAVARSALPEARTEVSALVRTPMHGAVRGPVTGEARTGDAEAERDAASAARSASARTGRRMPGTATGTSARPVSLEGKRSAQGAPATGGDRDCSGNRRERSDRRLERKARPEGIAQIRRTNNRQPIRIEHQHHRHHDQHRRRSHR